MTSSQLTDDDLRRVSMMSLDDLERLHQFTKKQLKIERLLEMANENVMSVRLPLRVVEQVSRLALRRDHTRSEVVRDAILQYISRCRA